MDNLFAPWRIEWVERDEPDVDCPFCALPARDPEEDRENNVLVRGERAVVMLNHYPYNPGHAMVIPREHTGDPRALDDATLLERARLLGRTLDAFETALAPDGFNTGRNLGGAAAGGSIDDHLHTHVVPRWAGDTSFMPVVGDTKVIVEAVAETYDRLHEAFTAQDGLSGGDPGDGAARFEGVDLGAGADGDGD